MIKSLLSTAVIALSTVYSLSAETLNYEFGNDIIGTPTSVSDNGRFGTVVDEENNIGYIWDSLAPESLTPTVMADGKRFCPNDISDDGLAVGYYAPDAGTIRPAILKDGVYTLLPVHPGTFNEAVANCVTPDGSVIAGTIFISDPSSEIAGRYYPVQWKLNAAGEYELFAYTDIELPDHQGFLVNCQSTDGEVLGGRLYCGVGSIIPAIIKNGELIYFNELATVSEPWMYKGKYYAGLDENGRQVWVEDVNDPRVVLFSEYFIDGFHDGNNDQFFDGEFFGIDGDGTLFGYRTQATNVDAEGNGTLKSTACTYNYKNGDWSDTSATQAFSIGVGNAIKFDAAGNAFVDGQKTPLSSLGVTASRTIGSAYRCSMNGQVLGVIAYEIHPASGERINYPVFSILPQSYQSGIEDVTIENVEAAKAVYDLNGRYAGTDLDLLTPGVYVVKNGSEVKKVIVK